MDRLNLEIFIWFWRWACGSGKPQKKLSKFQFKWTKFNRNHIFQLALRHFVYILHDIEITYARNWVFAINIDDLVEWYGTFFFSSLLSLEKKTDWKKHHIISHHFKHWRYINHFYYDFHMICRRQFCAVHRFFFAYSFRSISTVWKFAKENSNENNLKYIWISTNWAIILSRHLYFDL